MEVYRYTTTVYNLTWREARELAGYASRNFDADVKIEESKFSD